MARMMVIPSISERDCSLLIRPTSRLQIQFQLVSPGLTGKTIRGRDHSASELHILTKSFSWATLSPTRFRRLFCPMVEESATTVYHRARALAMQFMRTSLFLVHFINRASIGTEADGTYERKTALFTFSPMALGRASQISVLCCAWRIAMATF